jgi:hypothetical protein
MAIVNRVNPVLCIGGDVSQEGTNVCRYYGKGKSYGDCLPSGSGLGGGRAMTPIEFYPLFDMPQLGEHGEGEAGGAWTDHPKEMTWGICG